MSERARVFPLPIDRRGALLAALIGLAVLAGPAWGQGHRGNVSRGRTVAEAQCSECHAIGYEGPWMRRGVPGFPAIADLPSTTALSLRVVLQTTHARKRMPSLILSARDTDDVIAYILALVRK